METKKLTPQHYTVGWISPMEVEQTAALLMIDEEHERLPQPDADPTVYLLGSIAGHNVVIAGLPAQGNTSAATVVTHMRRSFPNLRFGLLVGIGGGVPTETDQGKIRLGDVIVSKPTGPHSGAVQYDHGKAEAGQFVRTGFLMPPPAALLNAAQMLAAKRATLTVDPIKTSLRRIDTTRPQLLRYRYPGIGQDILHSADCIPDLAAAPLQACKCYHNEAFVIQGCQASTGEVNRDQSREDTFIFVHRGTIASGEMVIKNGLLRDYLAQQHDIYCFETEAAGAMTDFPWLVIRGVSDYCDMHKNNLWHGYAAAVAAAYARELFFYMPISLATPPTQTIKEPQNLTPLPPSETRGPDVYKIAQWLSDLDFCWRQNEICCRRQPGTGEWLFISREFQIWLDSARDLLFCSGIPGAGKTFLASLVIDYLTKEFSSHGDVAIVYIYCDYKSQDKQKANLLLGDLLKQGLLQIKGPVPENIQDLYLRCINGKLRPTTHELLRHSVDILGLFQSTFLIIDGLDELAVVERRVFMHYIFQVQGSSSIKIFATSRSISEIRAEFSARECIEIEVQASDRDVDLYLQANKHKLPGWAQKSPGLFQATVDSITHASKGMFLLVYLLFESLLHKTTLKAYKRALVDLPSGINAAYQQIDQRIQQQNPEHRTLAYTALEWITCTTKLITIKELQTALSVHTDGDAPDDEDLPDIDTIVSVCCGLIEVGQMAQTVRFVHYTAKQFFEDTFSDDSTHEKIALTCITYLSLEIFASGPCADDETFEQRLALYPLYHYATQWWGYHARSGSTDLVKRILLFLSQEEKLESSSQALKASKLYIDDTNYSQRIPKSVTAAHILSHFGLTQVAQQLPNSFSNFSACDSEHKTPLAWAAESGHVGIIKYILTHYEATIHIRDHIGNSPLLLAAQRGHARVVNELIKHDETGSGLPNYFKRSPLWYAAEKGHVSVVDTLLTSNMVDINAKDIDGNTPLIRASANGHPSVVARLLDSGADINARESLYGRSGFLWAAMEGHTKIVELYIKVDCVMWEMVDNDGRSALWWAAEEGHTSVVRQLLVLSGKMNTNQLDTLHQRSMLSRAAEMGDEAIVSLLLGAKTTEPDRRDEDGLVPLAWAARGGHSEVVSLLLETGKVNIDAQVLEDLSFDIIRAQKHNPDFKPSLRKGQTPLSHAAEMGHRRTVALLLDHGAAADFPDSFRKTPLMYALENEHEDIFSLLLEQGADPNHFNYDGETPLIMAVQKRNIRLAKLLLATPGIIPSWEHRTGHSALWWAIFHNDITMLNILLDSGMVDQNIRDDATLLSMAARLGNEAAVRWLLSQETMIDPDRIVPQDGRSPLCCAAFGGHVEIMKLLLATGKVSIQRKDIYGRSVLSWASTREATRVLLNEGADPNDYDYDGRTPLSHAVEYGQRGKVELLLEHPKINVDLVDRHGSTPLFYVGSPERRLGSGGKEYLEYEKSTQVAGVQLRGEDLQGMAELLISHGVDPHVTNFDGHTALFPAVFLHHNALVAFLQQAGLTMDKRDNYGMTPAMYTSENILSSHDQGPERWLNGKLRVETDRQLEDEVDDDVFDNEEELLGMSLDEMGIAKPESTRDQCPFPHTENNALHSIGLSRQQLYSVPMQTQGEVEPPGVYGFFDEIEMANQTKILDEEPFHLPVLGRRFPTQN